MSWINDVGSWYKDNIIDPSISMMPFGIGSGYTSWQNYNAQKSIASDNLEFQKQQFAYQKNLQKQIFQREDNSVQRRSADLEAAGLSKTLAAGGGAGAGSVVSTQAPQREIPQREKAELNLDFAQIMLNLITGSKTIQKLDKEISNLDKHGNLLKAQTDKQKKETDMDDWDLKWLKNNNLSRYSSSGGKVFGDIKTGFQTQSNTWAPSTREKHYQMWIKDNKLPDTFLNKAKYLSKFPFKNYKED